MLRSICSTALLAVMVVTGCSAASSPTPALSVTPAAVPTSADELAPTPDAAEPTAEPQPALAPGQRAAPRGIDQGLHNDDVAVVAATGRPQLIEFLTYW